MLEYISLFKWDSKYVVEACLLDMRFNILINMCRHSNYMRKVVLKLIILNFIFNFNSAKFLAEHIILLKESLDVFACFIAVWDWHIKVQYHQIKHFFIFLTVFYKLLVCFLSVACADDFEIELLKDSLQDCKAEGFIVCNQALECLPGAKRLHWTFFIIAFFFNLLLWLLFFFIFLF